MRIKNIINCDAQDILVLRRDRTDKGASQASVASAVVATI